MSTLEEKIAEENLVVAKSGTSFALYFVVGGSESTVYRGSLESVTQYQQDFAIELAALVREHEEKDSERWRFYASNPQTALALGSKLDPNEDNDWAAECNRLADGFIAHDKMKRTPYDLYWHGSPPTGELVIQAPPEEPPKRGRKNVLSESQIEELVSLRRQGVTQRALAEKFKVATMTIQHHCNAAGVRITMSQARRNRKPTQGRNYVIA